MQDLSRLTETGHAIQLAVAPVFLLSGVSAMLAVLTNRLARIIDRGRLVEAGLPRAVPETAPDASAQLARITRDVRRSKTIVFDETLRSSPTNGTTTRFTAVAPNRLSYVTRGGPAAIVIGSRRWDRERPGAPYVESSQTP